MMCFLGAIAAALVPVVGADVNAAPAAPVRVLADWAVWPSPQARANLATAERAADGWLTIRTQTGAGRAGIVLRPEQGAWDLDAFAEIAVPVRNLGAANVRVILRVDDDRTESIPSVQHRGGLSEFILSPGPEPAWLVVPLGDGKPSPLAGEFLSMVAAPPDFVRRGSVQGAKVTAISLFVPDPRSEQEIAVGPMVARGVPAPLRALPRDRAFPFIDEFGQYAPGDWPGKTHAEGDLAARRQTEDADLAAHPRPAEWDRFGGWAAGPRREATGFFRVEKIEGAWWMVDPEGRLFWSHGVVRVGTRVRVGTVYHGTPILDRERYFRLPPNDSPLGAFYGTEPQSTRGYYVGKEGHAVYDFLEANLFRKYGADWQSRYAEQAQRRLASWGLNTVANSSDPAVYSLRRTPYTAVVYSAPLGRSEHRLEGSQGDWGKLPDPFDPGLRRLIERTLREELKASLNDPWCLGFFVDNELAWGDACHVAEVTLASPAGQPAKQAFVSELRKQYGGVEALNAAWGTRHASWEALLAATALPDRKREPVRRDLEAFSEQLLDTYFRCCRDSIQAAAPHQLYLGCRFAGYGNPLVMRAAARYCDVISINRYARTLDDLALPEGLDRPLLIGEFHFCAPDRVPFAFGLVPVSTQADRARAYLTYVESALRNPAVIGTHWFQFYDQPTTGRFDGENYPTGLLDTCDTPYAEMVAACRKMGAAMYPLRAKAAAASDAGRRSAPGDNTGRNNAMDWDRLTALSGCDLKPLGRLATKPASAIAASRFSVGCECLDRGMWNFDKAYPHLAALGAKWARVQTGWGKCEKAKGVYDFAWLDAIVDRLLAAGIQPWFNVGYGNRLYLPDAPHETAVGWTPIGEAGAREGWAAFTAALARHYRGRVTYYEVWNEPDIKAFWTPYEPSPDAYARLVALTSRSIRAANPEAKIIGGAMAGGLHPAGFAFIKRCFELGMGEHIDALSYHLYQATPDGFYERQLPALRDLVHAYRPGLPLWQGESGAPSKAQAGQALAQYEWDEAKQAKWFARRSVIDLALDTPLIALFHASDFEFYIVKDQIIPKPYYFGLVGGPDYQPKPAFFAAQTLCTLFAGEVRRSEAVHVEGAGQVYAFETGCGPLVAYWEPQDMMQPLTPRHTRLTVRMPRALALRRPVLIDPVSQQVYALPSATEEGDALRLDVPLTDWPLILAERQAVPLR